MRGYKAAVSVHESTSAAQVRIAELEALLSAERERSAQLEKEQQVLRASHERLRLELELLKRRLFLAKAERVDSRQLELEFAQKLRALEQVAGTLGMSSESQSPAPEGDSTKKRKASGRRDLKSLPLQEQRVEIADPLFDELVAQGKAERIGFEESCKLAWQRGGMRRLVVARVKYRTVGADGEAALETAMMPKELFFRCLAAPSLLAHLLVEKYCDGLPLFRLEQRLARDGVPVDRGTMARWVEDAGATVGATVVAAMREEALRTAFCIATDATGVAVQPVPTEGQRQACRRGHYFVQVADKDAIFFEYTARETSAAVLEMFKGFSGYVQADAKSVYDALFRPAEPQPPEGPAEVRQEVACWVHCRRGFWEATAAKNLVAREGLARIGRIFELDASWSDKPPEEIHRLRQAHLRVHVEAFFTWAQAEHEQVRAERGLLPRALGYALRHQQALCRFLDDGRLLLDNNRSERALRRIAVGRKAWLFVGSDDHAERAGHLFTLIATARLHGLDPEAYLRDLFRVLAHWPRERYLELAPKYWAATRARLAATELDAEVGELAVPAPLTSSAEEQVSSR
ncbi:IS66 family transposase [Stigmatella aurantiaca]|uniref:IS66 family transposase n=1 Tax=Stigmatella aurantiaca TaxID=41 RepID=UPI001FEBF7A2|nr:IS66 family transposase [Stigmatella aurantiaca]